MSDEIVEAILETVLESIEMIELRFTKISNPNDFISSHEGMTILDAISMRLQVIGEQTKKLERIDDNLLHSYPVIEWEKIMKLRDLISHHYDKLDHEIVYDICKNHVPELKRAIKSMMDKE